MSPQEVAALFTGDGGREDASAYLAREGLLDELRPPADKERIAPDLADLARLHAAVRARKVFTVLEFGVGYSTLAMADALLKNRADWESLTEPPRIRNLTPFQLHAVDTSAHWAEAAASLLPDRLRSIVTIHRSDAAAGTFHDRACHFYENLPDAVPDFIYLDGPDPADVKGTISGLGWQNRDRVVMSGDLLRLEPLLLPGTLVVIDGREANARFLRAHLYRNWHAAAERVADVTVLELQEPPLGRINQDTLAHCLGPRAKEWPVR